MGDADVRVGISGWRYPPWRGEFFPAGLAQRSELEYAASRLRTIEINGSFYSLQPPSNWRQWRDAVPADFEFSVKGGRFVTHMKRLRDAETPLANFFASSPLLLERAARPPPVAAPTELPVRRAGAGRVLRRAAAHRGRGGCAGPPQRAGDQPGRRRATLAASPKRHADKRIRHALEVRHPSFRDRRLRPSCCRAHDVAIVVSDGAEALAADRRGHVRPRLRPAARRRPALRQRLPEEDLDRWADRVRGWAAAPEVRPCTSTSTTT